MGALNFFFSQVDIREEYHIYLAIPENLLL